jgi:hypothetical protein
VFDAIAAWQNAQGLVPEHVLANVVDMTAAKAEKITVSRDLDKDGEADIDDTVEGEQPGYLNFAKAEATVSTNMKSNKDWLVNLYKFTKNAAGEYVFEDVGTLLERTVDFTKNKNHLY